MRAIFAIALLVSASAYGTTFHISGTVTTVDDPNDVLGGAITGNPATGLGDLWTGWLSYDLSTPDSADLDPTKGVYAHQPPLTGVGLSITVNGLTFSTASSNPFVVEVFNDHPSNKDMLIASQTGATSSVGAIDFLNLRLTDWTAGSFGSDALPTELLLSDALRGFVNVGAGPGTGTLFIDFEVEDLTPVPLPSTIGLFAAGLVGLGWIRRRHQKARAA